MRNYFFERTGLVLISTALVLWNMVYKESPIREDNLLFLAMNMIGAFFIILSVISVCIDTVRYIKWKRKKPWGQ
jgi:multisubunit Na+/H+ antiporter MnhB subunit